MVGLPRTPSIWQAVVEAHERELMMQRDRRREESMRLCECGRVWLRAGDRCIFCEPVVPPGRPVGVTPAELMARQLRLAQAIAGEQRSEIEDAILAYMRKLNVQRAACLKDERLWDQARALLVRAGCEPPR